MLNVGRLGIGLYFIQKTLPCQSGISLNRQGKNMYILIPKYVYIRYMPRLGIFLARGFH